MNIPEGWKLVPVEPTREMIISGHDEAWASSDSTLSGGDAALVYEAMLAAAPTPPDHIVDANNMVSAQVDKIANMQGTLVDKTQNLQESPPAQDDEPVAEVGENYVFLLRKQDSGDRWPVGTKLYTRPDNSRLRKAAEEALHWLEYMNISSVHNHTQVERARHAENNLRAELNKGEA